MSLLTYVDGLISLSYTKDNIIDVLKWGEKLNCTYMGLESRKMVFVEEAADLVMASDDSKWKGDLLDIKVPDIEFSFGIGFFAEKDIISISLHAFDYESKSPLYYEFYGADFAPYIEFLLKLVEPYVLLSIDVGSMR